MRNPFAKPGESARHLKLAVTGKSNAGKTCFGLDAKNHGMGPVAIISMEGGDVLYEDSPRWGGFSPLRTQSIAELEEAIEYLATNPGAFGTVVVDTVTALYEALVDAKAKEDGSVNKNAWGLIKRKWKSLMARLVNLPLNVVFVVHENDIVEEDAKGAFKVVGQKLDAEKTFERAPDFLLRLGWNDGKHFARVLKVRGEQTGFRIGQVIETPHIGMFAKAIKAGGAETRIAPPEEVAKANEAAMATGADRGAAPDASKEAKEPAHDPETGEVLPQGLQALMAAVDAHAPFEHEAHMKNWWKKHGAAIKALTTAEQNVLRRALRAKTPELAKESAA